MVYCLVKTVLSLNCFWLIFLQSGLLYIMHYMIGMHAEELNKAMNAESDDGLESFEKLFSKFQLMKGEHLAIFTPCINE